MGPGSADAGGAGVAHGDAGTYNPEEELALPGEPPQAGERYLFVASPGLDAVVRIDGVSLAVDLIEVGGDPQAMAMRPGKDELVVFNAGTRDFSVVRAAEAIPEVITLDASEVVNRLAVDAAGDYAVGWYDPQGPGPEGDLQEVQVVRLGAGEETVTPIGVGFHPREVSFDGAGRAFVVTDDGVSIITLSELSGPGFARAVAVTDDPLESPQDREVLVTPDGKRAVVRRGGVPEVRIVDLETELAVTVDLESAPTDLDLSLDGTEALLALRETAQLVRVPVASPDQANSMDLQGVPVGLITLTDDGDTALLHTSQPGGRWLGKLSLGTGKLVFWPLQKDARAVFPVPGGATALVFHRASAADPAEDALTQLVAASDGYSVVDLATGFAKLQLHKSPPLTATALPDGSRAYVLIPATSAGHNGVDAIDLKMMLATFVPLGSPPEHAVFIPAGDRLAISQQHPVGRITFLSTLDGTTETVTGFQLNGLIR